MSSSLCCASSLQRDHARLTLERLVASNAGNRFGLTFQPPLQVGVVAVAARVGAMGIGAPFTLYRPWPFAVGTGAVALLASSPRSCATRRSDDLAFLRLPSHVRHPRPCSARPPSGVDVHACAAHAAREAKPDGCAYDSAMPATCVMLPGGPVIRTAHVFSTDVAGSCGSIVAPPVFVFASSCMHAKNKVHAGRRPARERTWPTTRPRCRR